MHTSSELQLLALSLLEPLTLDAVAVARCMRSAQRKGVDPYNSHTTQAACWNRAWADKARRC